MPRTPFILVGTRSDLRKTVRQRGAAVISKEQGFQLADRIGAECYVECSSLSGEGLRDVFVSTMEVALKSTSDISEDDSTCGCRCSIVWLVTKSTWICRCTQFSSQRFWGPKLPYGKRRKKPLKGSCKSHFSCRRSHEVALWTGACRDGLKSASVFHMSLRLLWSGFYEPVYLSHHHTYTVISILYMIIFIKEMINILLMYVY